MSLATARRATAYRSRLDSEPLVVPRREPVVWGDLDGPIAPDDLVDYDRRGFLTVDQLVDTGEVAVLQDEAFRLAADPELATTELVVREPDSDQVRSVFDIHRVSDVFADLVADERLAGRARQILGSEVYVHQSRVNFKPGYRGREFYWHSDFETWHGEDGMPAMRAVSISVALTENTEVNGSVMIIPGSHRVFVGCVGATPERHYRQSLRSQQVGVPDDDNLARLVGEHGICQITGGVGSALVFDSNCMHGSNSNITPFARSNLFIVYNSVDNPLGTPFAGTPPRPEFVAHRTVHPVGRR
ncbi:MAG: ectoine hydroxylase [Acidimicrobiia bacterium]|nr:ectoine hydroxylase [Acidimicrobiia bacterium]